VSESRCGPAAVVVGRRGVFSVFRRGKLGSLGGPQVCLGQKSVFGRSAHGPNPPVPPVFVMVYVSVSVCVSRCGRPAAVVLSVMGRERRGCWDVS